MTTSAAVLKNKGVPVDVAVVEIDPEAPSAVVIDGVIQPPGYRLARDSKGAVKVEKLWVRFDANSLSDLEEAYDGLAFFEQATQRKPISAVRRCLAIIMGVDERRAGLAMLEGRISEYTTAIGVSLAIANGVDPTQAAKMLEVGIKAVKESDVERAQQIAEMISTAEKDDDSPGPDGSAPGVQPEGTSTSSGG